MSSAQALSTKAIQKEVNKEYDAAFELHIKAAEAFMDLAQTLTDTNAKATCKAAVKKALDRAGQIKKVMGDVVRPVLADPHSPRQFSIHPVHVLDNQSFFRGANVYFGQIIGREWAQISSVAGRGCAKRWVSRTVPVSISVSPSNMKLLTW